MDQRLVRQLHGEATLHGIRAGHGFQRHALVGVCAGGAGGDRMCDDRRFQAWVVKNGGARMAYRYAPPVVRLEID